MHPSIKGFSKLSKAEKIAWITTHFTQNPEAATQLLERYGHPDPLVQKLHDEFIENPLSNYYLPFAIAPNFKINGTLYAIPMVLEESSVVAAASKAAKYWLSRGGFKATIIGTEKVGQVHFIYKGDAAKLQHFIKTIQPILHQSIAPITHNMRKRGGGLKAIVLRNLSDQMAGYYQLHCTFETQDAMGANFINTCLEQLAKTLVAQAKAHDAFTATEKHIEVVMSILSNYVPHCRVRAEVSCPVAELNEEEMPPETFAQKFVQAVTIAQIEPHRAVTHNKGIMNGIDAVVLATGNDFRAVEAGVHAYAARLGQYTSLTHASLEDHLFKFWIEVPLALGTVGGLTDLHPLTKLALEILQNPTAEELMQIVAVAGLAQNFAALRSLVTTGIQKGHMKMHLLNLLNQMGATESEKQHAIQHFTKHTVTHAAVKAMLATLRVSSEY